METKKYKTTREIEDLEKAKEIYRQKLQEIKVLSNIMDNDE
jgi:hypothetical protein